VRASTILAAVLALGAWACADSPDPTGTKGEPVFSDSHLPPGAVPVRTCGRVLTEPGDYWVMKDLSCGTSYVPLPAISISGTDITLHLNGHTIRSTPGAPGDGCLSMGGSGNAILGPGTLGTYCEHAILLAGAANRIRGIYLQSFDLGIVGGGPDHRIEDVTFDGGGYSPIFLQGGGGIDRLVLRGNTVKGHLENGFDLLGDAMVIENNTIEGSGFGLKVGTTGTLIRNNWVRHTGWPGLGISGSGNTISNNVFRHNLWDIDDTNANPCTANHYANNRFTRASDPCIQ